MDNSQKLESVKGWLIANRDQRVKDNEYLSKEQIGSLEECITALINDAREDNLEMIIEQGNARLLEMNNWIDEERVKRIPSKEEFLKRMYASKEESKELDCCKFIMELFDNLLDLKLYERAIEYMTSVEVSKITNHGGTLFCMMTGSNPISPLLRPIPTKESVAEYSVKRYQFFEAVKKHFEDNGNEELAKAVHVAKPENYDRDVEQYDMLYIGGAPKDK